MLGTRAGWFDGTSGVLKYLLTARHCEKLVSITVIVVRTNKRSPAITYHNHQNCFKQMGYPAISLQAQPLDVSRKVALLPAPRRADIHIMYHHYAD